MKNYLLASVFAVCALAAHSQNNQADIRQTGSGNTNTVQQTGMNEKLTLIQGTKSNTAVQTNADIVMEGNANEVYIKQVGFTHQAIVKAAGEHNDVDINQQGSTNLADVEITSNRTPTNNHLDIHQDGKKNEAYMGIQGGENHRFKIKQAGGGNYGLIRQYYSSDNIFSIDQNGHDNWAEIREESDLAGDQASVKQVGNDNRANVEFNDSELYSSTRDNKATVRQTGNGNDATVRVRVVAAGDEDFGPFPDEIANNEAEVNQHGDDNIALLWQYGSDNFGKIQQNGTGNDASLTQAGLGDRATITQIGSGNVSVVAQGVALP